MLLPSRARATDSAGLMGVCPKGPNPVSNTLAIWMPLGRRIYLRSRRTVSLIYSFG